MRFRIACLLLVAACADDRCPATLADYCAGASLCPPTWTAAQDPATWGCGTTSEIRVALLTCGGVHVARTMGVDAGTDFYYDASGQLYRVARWGASSEGSYCEAGRGPGPECNAPAPVPFCAGH